MKKLSKICLALTALSLTAACSSSADTSKKVQALQNKDKQLTCKEILLEMNEADFYKGMANKNKGPKLKYMLMPLGYISTYMDAEEAIEASNARVSYLNKIYEISGCEAGSSKDTMPVTYQQQPQMQQHQQQQPTHYYNGQQQMVQQMQQPQVHYQMQPRVSAPMHPQTAAMPVYDDTYPNGFTAY